MTTADGSRPPPKILRGGTPAAHRRHTIRPVLTSEGSTVTAQSDSNPNGSRHRRRRGSERRATGHGRCRTVKDRLGVKGSQVRILSSRRPSEARCSWGLAQVSGLFSSRVVPALSIYTAGVWGPFVDHLWTPRGFRGATRAGTRCAVPGPGARRKWVQDRGWWLCGCGRAVRSSAKGKRGPREIRCVPRSRTRRSHGASHAGHVGKTRPSLPFANRKRLSFSI